MAYCVAQVGFELVAVSCFLVPESWDYSSKPLGSHKEESVTSDIRFDSALEVSISLVTFCRQLFSPFMLSSPKGAHQFTQAVLEKS